MQAIIQHYSFVELAFILYLGLAIAKTILCFASAGIAAGTLRRKLGTHHSVWYYLTFVLIGIPFVIFFRLPALLWHEGFSFFALTPRRKAIRDVLDGL